MPLNGIDGSDALAKWEKKVDRVFMWVYAERKIQMQANARNLIMIRAGSFFL